MTRGDAAVHMAAAAWVRPLFHVLAALFPILSAGCYDDVWRNCRDGPHPAAMAVDDVEKALLDVNSVYADARRFALRTVAEASGRARREGNAREADRLADAVIRRYHVEKDPSVRACIVFICVPAAGRGSVPMVLFLRDRIAAGEFPGRAAISLAYLAPRGAYEDITPLTRHPSPGVRLEAAVALTILGDPRGGDAVRRVLRSMKTPEWPGEIAGQPLSGAAGALRGRAERAFGPLFDARDSGEDGRGR